MHDEKLRICNAINKLTSDESDSLTILAGNPEELDGNKKRAIDCSGLWNDFKDERFMGKTLADALESAAEEKRLSKIPSDLTCELDKAGMNENNNLGYSGGQLVYV